MREVQELGRLQRSGRSSRVRQFSLTSFREAQRPVVRACGRLVLGHGALRTRLGTAPGPGHRNGRGARSVVRE
jgi:hypothetical protein